MQQTTQDLYFAPHSFVGLPLPYHSSGVKFSRSSGNLTITLLSANGVPYGRWGRVTACIITTAAFRTPSLRLEFSSIYQLLSSVGFKDPGGYRLQEFANRMKMWGTLTITESCLVDAVYQSKVTPLTTTAKICLQKELQCNEDVSYIELSSEGKSFLTTSAVPGVLEHVVAIRQPKELDLYFWIARKLHNSKYWGASAKQFVPWQSMYTQFGTGNGKVMRAEAKPKFRREICEYILDIKQTYYPKANLALDDKGIYFSPSPNLISPKDKAATLLPVI